MDYRVELVKAIRKTEAQVAECKKKLIEAKKEAENLQKLQQLQDNTSLSDSATVFEKHTFVDSFLKRKNSIKKQLEKVKEIFTDVQVKEQECNEAFADFLSMKRKFIADMTGTDTVEAAATEADTVEAVTTEAVTAEAVTTEAVAAEAVTTEAVTA